MATALVRGMLGAGLARADYVFLAVPSQGLDEVIAGLNAAELQPGAAVVSLAKGLVPPDGVNRFTVVVEGPKNGDLVHAWSKLCQPGEGPPPSDFAAVYPFVTTVQGNRFRFRGGDPGMLRESLERLFRDRLEGAPIKTYVEN